MEVSVGISKLQGLIAKASKDADFETVAELQALGSELIDAKTSILVALGTNQPHIDVGKVKSDARAELLREIVGGIESEVSGPCFVAVREFLRDYFELELAR